MAVVNTYKNTNFDDWKNMVMKEFAKRDMVPISITPLRMLHSYEGGDTPYSWCDHIVRQDILQKRTIMITLDNPDKK